MIDAGKYDGPFGVIAGILAAGHFARAGLNLPFGIDVLAFGDEEARAFPQRCPHRRPARACFARTISTLADRNGVTLGDAIAGYGKSVADIRGGACRCRDVAAYVEVHIEQGPVLETRNSRSASSTAIVGQTYLNVELLGEAGHAGTCRCCAARRAGRCCRACCSARRSRARARGEVVATVGRIAVAPGATSVIPARSW